MNGFLDLAILQIDDAGVDKLPFVPMGDSDTLTQGQDVFATGTTAGKNKARICNSRRLIRQYLA